MSFTKKEPINSTSDMPREAPNPQAPPPDAPILQVAAMDNVSNNNIPTFTGVAANITLENWLDNVNEHKTLRNWSEGQTVSAAKLKLEGKAAVWKQNAIAETPEVFSSWSTLKEALWSRFGQQKTPTENTNALHDCKQQFEPYEEIKDFHDRSMIIARNFMSSVKKEECAKDCSSADPCAVCKQAKNAVDHVKFQTFIKGMLPHLRQAVQADGSSDTVDKALKVAQDKEQSLKNSRPRGQNDDINAVEYDVQEWYNRGRGQTKGNFRGGPQRGRGRGRGGGQDFRRRERNQSFQPRKPRFIDVPLKDRPNTILCFRCKKYGRHYAKECKVKIQNVNSMEKEKHEKEFVNEGEDTEYYSSSENE